MNSPATAPHSTFSLRRLVARFPLTIFYVLAYALSWWSAPFGGLIPHGPMLAAIAVLALTEGRAGPAGLWRQFARVRVPWVWYVAAPGLIVLVHALALAIYLAAGGSLPGAGQVDARFLLGLWPLLLLGGQWEEPGWTGYALPRLQARYAHLARGALVASLIVGLLRGLWHLPLVLMGAIPWYDALFLALAMQIVITWMYNRTGGSLLLVMLFHLASNIAGAIVPQLLGGNFNAYYPVFVAVSAGLALAVVAAAGPALGGRGAPEPAAQPEA